MDEFEALLATKAPPKGAIRAPAVDEFDALLASTKPTRAAAVPEKTPAPEGHLEGWVKPAAKKLVGAGADLVDLVFTGLLAPPVAAAGQLTTMIQGELNDGLGIKKSTRRERAQAGLETAGRINKALGTPVRSLLTSLGYLSADDAPVEEAMGKVMSLVEQDAAAVEERTGGKVLKEDVLGAVNVLFGGLGAKGTQIAGKKIVDVRAAKAATKALEDLKAERAGENLAAEEAVNEAAATKRSEADLLRETEMRRAVRAAFVEEPAYARRPPPDNRFPPSGERTGSTDAVDLSRLPGRTAPVVRPGEEIGSSANQLATVEALRRRGLAADVPEAQRGAVGVSPSDSLGSAIAKTNTGRAWDLTAEERIAIRATQSKMDPKILTAAAVGATGLGLAMAMGPDAEEAALAVGAGALMLGRGKGLTLDTMTKMGEATPLGAILDQSATTLSTLEKLPRNRFEFSVQSIQELLKRQEVTKAERDVFAKVLEGKPADGTVTAKELMVGVKKATGDFELTKRASDEFADYGLANLDRTERSMSGIEDWIPEGANAAEIARLQAEARAAYDAAPMPSTHIYRVPESITLGSNNHFRDPQYFGHTRVFEEGGVRHVVELQSDLAQKAGKVLGAEERAKLEGHLENVQEQLRAIRVDDIRSMLPDNLERVVSDLEKHNPDVKHKLGQYLESAGSVGDSFDLWDTVVAEVKSSTDSPTTSRLRLLRDSLRNYQRQLTTLASEHKAKLAESGAITTIEPMLKNWHKRLIREELADGARAGEVQVRFADADTVAKVEGWPDRDTGGATQLRQTLEDAARRFDEAGMPEAAARERARLAQTPTRGGTRFSPEHQGIYDRYSGDITKFLKQLGGKHVVDSAGHGWWEVPVEGSKAVSAGKRVQQFGGASQDLLEKVAIIGGGAALTAYLSSDEHRARNAGMAAIVAGLAIFARSRSPQIADWAGQAGRGAEYALGLVSTRVKDLSPTLLRRMRDHEMAVLKSTHENLSAVAPFVESLRKVPTELRDRLNRAVLSGESGEVIRLLGQTGNPELVSQWRTVRKTLDTLGNNLVTTGKLKGLLTDYYPRVVIDAKGLLEALGKEERSYLQTKIDEATHAAARQSRDLSPLEVSQIINKYLKGRGPTSGKPGFLKKRSVDEITEELAPFYAPASESLPLYVRAVSKELERARFFGDDLVRKDGIANLDLSIGGLVERERALRKLDDTQVEELRGILTSRFGPGERASAGLIQTAKNLTNAGLLGHATSAFVQLGDVLVSTYAHGILPTIKGLQQVTMRDPARITVRDLGMIDHISEEIVSPSRQPIVIGGMTLSSAKFLDGVFKYSGFSLVDQLGKNVSIAAATNKYAKAMQSPAGVSKFKEKYKDAYSSAELDQAVADFRSRENTDLTRSVLFSELSNIQPISKLEVPQGYLDMPNGRIVYMLKTFMLKQADIVRRDALQEFRKGNYAKGASNLLRYSIALGIGGATTDFVRNWLLGKEQKADWGSLPDNVLKTFGMSQYVIEKARRGEPVAAIGQTALPPYKMWEHILTTEPEAIQYIPLAGKFLYMHGMGGAEKANASAEKRRAAAERKAEGLGKEKEE